MAKLPLTTELWAIGLAAEWAQQLNLRPGNLWEPALARNMKEECRRLGDDASARAFVEATFRMRLGLEAKRG